MKILGACLIYGLLLVFLPPLASSTDQINERKMARAVRQAVRDADSTLLHASTLAPWREYLKIVALNLQADLQPLVLIKFDEDVSFRNQLKTLIEWERQWQKKETEHFIYYYRWDQPPPEFILEVQDAHFNEIAKLFHIEAEEKIPYRYDLTVEEGEVYPFEDLRGGIVSAQPFDLQKGVLAILYFINSEPASILRPLSRIYGDYYQNRSTSAAYYEMCMDEIQKNGYISADKIYRNRDFEKFSDQEWYSSYAFVYTINQEYGPEKIAQFLARVNASTETAQFHKAFEETFGVGLTEFEKNFTVKKNTAIKL